MTRFLSVAAVFLLLAASHVASAQSPAPSDKVRAAIPASQLAAMTAEEVNWKNFLAEQWCIVSHNPEKAAGLPLAQPRAAGASTRTEDFNPLLWNFDLAPHHQYFRLDDEGHVVLVQSEARLQTLFSRYQAAHPTHP